MKLSDVVGTSSPLDGMVARALWDLRDGDDWIEVSYAQIAEGIDTYSGKGVSHAVGRLEERGVLLVKRNPPYANQYRFTTIGTSQLLEVIPAPEPPAPESEISSDERARMIEIEKDWQHISCALAEFGDTLPEAIRNIRKIEAERRIALERCVILNSRLNYVYEAMNESQSFGRDHDQIADYLTREVTHT